MCCSSLSQLFSGGGRVGGEVGLSPAENMLKFTFTFRLYVSLKNINGTTEELSSSSVAQVSTTSNGKTPPPSGPLQIKQLY